LTQPIISLLVAFLATIAFILVSRPLAHRWGWLDLPSTLKTHQDPTPMIGGPAIFVGIALAVAYSGATLGANHLLLDVFPLLLLGLVDDIWKLRPSSRLIIQVAVVAQIIIVHSASFVSLGDLFGTGNIYLGVWTIPFTLFAMVGLINAINLSDGMDGLAGGYSFIALLLLALVAGSLGAENLLITLLICLGAVSAFLLFNLRHPWRARASIFLGDSGSLILGMVLGIVAWKITQRPGPHMPPVVALWIFALPLMDTVAIMIRRMAQGKSPLQGDRQHLHHLLQDAGFSHGQGVAVLLLAALACGVFGIAAWQLGVPDYWLMAGFLLASLVYLWCTFHPARTVAGVAAFRQRLGGA
jgi:UDP-GlcNAc:undecaprenyl-phosphate/decaprenyl-phosphate GlcNAc-1-phosphate transferase